MCCAIHAVLHAVAGATDAWSCFVQHATCEFMFSHNFECTSALCKFCKFCSVLFYTIIVCIVLFCMRSICSAHWQGRGAVQLKILLMQQSKRIWRCKMQLSPWQFHLPSHSLFFSLAIRPCTIEDSAFTYAVNCATGSLLAAALLCSALFSLPPCYFGA